MVRGAAKAASDAAVLRVRADDDPCCDGSTPGDGLKPRGQVFGELAQGFIVFGEPAGDVFDCQVEAKGRYRVLRIPLQTA